ncbi:MULTISPECIES: LLM class F420-dependent oxidoreductase [unclassified Pseudofrankia]|uniref:LLM class F420-dependent oxidoreductase n=1 Tax=unclassified Pseudofrankia TaxID=2994372 RepID=UPI0008DAC62F|nr:MULTISPECIES: LLM class F420-dependent oxidoreductase [unclassified Pseudofrankia]MDT3439999.1 LLM class F420-dependent oxidoreductase [Pseudofrankia sp. BMG5.37]OHV48454.1 LLM class F420-dependent oxidoreductase [Pseudofrankia sp. BMG5.36]
MRIGLQIPEFTWPGGPEKIGPTLAAVGRTADDVGFSHITVMDHFFQIPQLGPPTDEMLEAYTALTFLAAHTSRAALLALVTGVVYRPPGLLAKIVSTLDVLSGGRTWLGIGAAWDEEESLGLGLPFPPLAERFEMLEESVQIILRMWEGDDSPYDGRHYRLERPLNSPQPLAVPHPPIMIGGSGEKKTLRLVARYAQACNFFPTPALPRKLAVLREHCEREGRSYDEIEKTCFLPFDIGPDGERAADLLPFLERLAGLGVQTVIGSVPDIWRLRGLEAVGKLVIPAVEDL